MAGGFAQNLTDEELIGLYINQNLSAEEIAELYHTTRCAVLCVMSKRGIKKPKELSVQKQKESNLKKYGVVSTLQIKEIQEKIAQTCLGKYGNSSVCSVGGVKTQEKLASHALSEEEKARIQEKREQTSLERYGAKSYNQTEECRIRTKKTNLERYGVENPMQNKDVQQRLKQSLLDKYGVDNSMKLPENKAKLSKIRQEQGLVIVSEPQAELFKRLVQIYGQNNVQLNYPCGALLFDCCLFLGNCSIDIEYDGWYWHKTRKEYDYQRDWFAKSQGYKILRVKSGQLLPTNEVLISKISQLQNSEKTYVEIILDDWGKEQYPRVKNFTLNEDG